MSWRMESVEKLWRRTNEAGIRFVMIEIDIAEAVLKRLRQTTDPETRAIFVKEARARVETAARCSVNIEFPEAGEGRIAQRIQYLKDQLEQVAGSGRRAQGRG